MTVPYTSYHRSIALDEASARAIAAQTHLFGYKPDVVPTRGQWHLSLCSSGDDAALLQALRRRIHKLDAQISKESTNQDLIEMRAAAQRSLDSAAIA